MNLNIFQKNKEIIKTPEEIKEILKKAANPNCKKCYGRGYIGTKDYKRIIKGKEVTFTRYIKCGQCIKE